MFDWNELGMPAWARDGPTGDGPRPAVRCRFPGCRKPARRGIRPDDKVPLCRRHYWMVRYGGWRVISGPGRTLVWIDPHGERYHGRPGDAQ